MALDVREGLLEDAPELLLHLDAAAAARVSGGELARRCRCGLDQRSRYSRATLDELLVLGSRRRAAGRASRAARATTPRTTSWSARSSGSPSCAAGEPLELERRRRRATARRRSCRSRAMRARSASAPRVRRRANQRALSTASASRATEARDQARVLVGVARSSGSCSIETRPTITVVRTQRRAEHAAGRRRRSGAALGQRGRRSGRPARGQCLQRTSGSSPGVAARRRGPSARPRRARRAKSRSCRRARSRRRRRVDHLAERRCVDVDDLAEVEARTGASARPRAARAGGRWPAAIRRTWSTRRCCRRLRPSQSCRVKAPTHAASTTTTAARTPSERVRRARPDEDVGQREGRGR